MLKHIAVAAFAAVLIATPASADEVTDTISDALRSYESGDFSGASQSLNYAVQLIAQMNASNLAALLPAALSGWQAGEVENNSSGMAMFGGGIQASRSYTRGNDDIRVELLGDSPLLAQFIGIFSNPAMMGMMGKPVRVNNQSGLEDEQGKLIFVVANRFLVQIEGSAGRDEKLAYAGAIDFRALSSFGQ